MRIEWKSIVTRLVKRIRGGAKKFWRVIYSYIRKQSLSIEIGGYKKEKRKIIGKIKKSKSNFERRNGASGAGYYREKKYPRCWQKRVASFRCVKTCRPKSDRSLYKRKRKKKKRHSFRKKKNPKKWMYGENESFESFDDKLLLFFRVFFFLFFYFV